MWGMNNNLFSGEETHVMHEPSFGNRGDADIRKSQMICRIVHSTWSLSIIAHHLKLRIFIKMFLYIRFLHSPFSIIFIAIGPCPCPSDNESSLAPPNPMSSANLSSAAVGSAPGDRINSSGDVALLSLNALGKSNGGGSIYFWPSFSLTNACTAGMTWMRNNVNVSTRKCRVKLDQFRILLLTSIIKNCKYFHT